MTLNAGLLRVGCSLIVLAMIAVAAAQTAGIRGDAQNGKTLFLAEGCYTCHGTTGTGAASGPQLAPKPIPMAAFIYQLRHPRGAPPYGNIKMPAFGESVLSDAQVADIYAYLASIPPGLSVSQIPLLNQ